MPIASTASWTRSPGLDDAADLPHGFVHPDFVPANAIRVADGGLVILD